MIRLLLFLLLLAVPAGAQVAQVTTGEHDGFSRLVFTFPAPQRWSLRRDAGGYVLDAGTSKLRYDLSRVFDRIPHDRLSAVWAEPDTGALRLQIGCACHATAFDLRPGLLVIDLRDGPAPPGSPFETAADGLALPPLSAHPPRRPMRRPTDAAASEITAAAGYDWLAAHNGTVPPPAPALPATPSLPASAEVMADHGALRAAMVEQLARGAARGVVKMALPAPPTEAPANPSKPMEQVRVHGTPGLAVRSDDTVPPVTGVGTACADEAALALSDWGDARPVAEALSRRTGALTGEFDRPDPVAAADAVRYLLHLGFGVEARQILSVMAPDLPERPLWEGLARLLDDEGDPERIFAGMEVCDGAAALWAVLALPDLPPGDTLQRAAVLRSFSALPLHLRRDLGPRLAARFLGAEDLAAARAVQEAILRAPGDAGPGTAMMATRLDAAQGHTVSTTRLDKLGAAPGSVGVEATLMTVEEALLADAPPDPALAASVEALLREYGGAREGPALRRAAALLRALGGDEVGAFALADDAVALEIWQVLAAHGGDGAVLEAAVGTPPPEGLDPATQRILAARLLGLGLPGPALAWLPPDAADADIALAARAHLARGDGRGALRALAGRDIPDAAPARAEALRQLGDPAAAEAYAALDDKGGLARTQRAKGDWAALADGSAEPWAEAAALALPAAPAPDEGALARSARLVAETAATRDRLARLLAETAPQP